MHEVGLKLANSTAPMYEELPNWAPPWYPSRAKLSKEIAEELRANAEYHQRRIDEIKQDYAAGRGHLVKPYDKKNIEDSVAFSAEAIRCHDMHHSGHPETKNAMIKLGNYVHDRYGHPPHKPGPSLKIRRRKSV